MILGLHEPTPHAATLCVQSDPNDPRDAASIQATGSFFVIEAVLTREELLQLRNAIEDYLVTDHPEVAA